MTKNDLMHTVIEVLYVHTMNGNLTRRTARSVLYSLHRALAPRTGYAFRWNDILGDRIERTQVMKADERGSFWYHQGDRADAKVSQTRAKVADIAGVRIVDLVKREIDRAA